MNTIILLEMNSSTNNYFKIAYGHSTDHFHICHDLNDLFIQLYVNLFRTRNLSTEDITIYNYYMDCPITCFNVRYQNGLVIFNEENYIKASTIYPELSALDVMASKFLENNTTVSKPTLSKPTICKVPSKAMTGELNLPVSGQCKSKNLGSSYLENARIAKEMMQKKSKVAKSSDTVRTDGAEVEDVSDGVTKELVFKRNETNNEKFKIFESDKRSYIQMKRDIDEGWLDKEHLNPAFVMKYQIFKILEARNSIDTASDQNISQEYEFFSSLYNECQVDDQDCAKDGCPLEQPVKNKVYVPYNYHYMTNDKKEEYAKKYKLTRQQFEDMYLNSPVNDDVIENHIMSRSEPRKETEPVTNQIDTSIDTSDDSSDETSDDDSNTKKVDTKFIDLYREYNDSR